MYDIVDQVLAWRAAGRPVRLVRLVETQGFSSRLRVGAAAVAPGQAPVGSLLVGGSELDAGIVAELDGGPDRRLTELTVAHERASGAGLSCGGRIQVLVQPATDIPPEAWTRMRDREVVYLVTELHGSTVKTTRTYTPATLGEVRQRYAGDPARLLAAGGGTARYSGKAEAVVTALLPTLRLVVVGTGLIADALVAQAGLLGWHADVTGEVAEATMRAENLAPGDAIVVLSHDREVDGPTLAAALSGRAGYVGALGSRRTQAERAAWLTERSVDPADLGRIHGPAGLDIGARTPAEIALAIAAEILNQQSSASGKSLHATSGPIHADPVR
jgi:xanthine dehydrogenase accessory factor